MSRLHRTLPECRDMKMIIRTLSVGPMEANCYILGCEETRSAMVIDPGAEAERIKSVIDRCNLRLELIVNTHAHVDHIAANSDLKEKTSALLCIHSTDAEMLVNPQENLSFFIGIPVSSRTFASNLSASTPNPRKL